MRFTEFEVMSFDCYGTLIDWESGILGVLREFCATHDVEGDDAALLERYAALESRAQRGAYRRYRDVLRSVMQGFAESFGVSGVDGDALAASLPGWRPFADTVPALRELRQRYRLAIISNTDDDLIAETMKHLEVPFEFVITAEQVGAYKPSHRNFERALEVMGVGRDRLLHVAQSRYHDIAPANALGIANVWVNRPGATRGSGATSKSDAVPGFEVPDLSVLARVVKGSGA